MLIEESTSFREGSRRAAPLILAGLGAAVVMTVLAYLLRGFGLGAPDFAAEYGAILNRGNYPRPDSGLWVTGLVWHLLNGAFVFPFLFDCLQRYAVLPRARFPQGVLYGTGLWGVMGLVVATLAGEGLFFSQLNDRLSMVITSLVSWIIYGIVLERLARVRAVRYRELVDRQAA